MDVKLGNEVQLFWSELEPLTSTDTGELNDGMQLPPNFLRDFNKKALALDTDSSALCYQMDLDRLCGTPLVPMLLDTMRYQNVELTELAFKMIIHQTSRQAFLLQNSSQATQSRAVSCSEPLSPDAIDCA